MLEDLWNGILELTAQFVIPDWGALIALLPVFIFVLTVVILAVDVPAAVPGPEGAAAARAGSSREPAGLHMPGPSFAPILASFGVFLLFLGLVFPRPAPGVRRDRPWP